MARKAHNFNFKDLTWQQIGQIKVLGFVCVMSKLWVGEMVYLASPFTHQDKTVEEARFQSVAKCCGWLMTNYPDKRKHFFSPIAAVHAVAKVASLPGDWGYWAAFDENFISRCNEFWVLCIPGFRKSVGVTAERAIAKKYGLPCKWVIPQPDGTYSVSETEPNDVV